MENKDNGSLQYSLTVDSWAMGILAYELLVGFPPFNDKQRANIDNKIRYDVPRFPAHLSKEAQGFILAALSKDPIDRPTIIELINSPWIRAHRKSAPASNARPQSQLRALQADELGGVEQSSPSKHFGIGTHAPQGGQGDIRTNDGDLLAKPDLKSFNSFSMGQGHHAKMVQEITAKIGNASVSPPELNPNASRFAPIPAAAMSKFQQQILPSGGSFSSSVNPMLWRKK
jgi:serine/threonine protein kinase